MPGYILGLSPFKVPVTVVSPSITGTVPPVPLYGKVPFRVCLDEIIRSR